MQAVAAWREVLLELLFLLRSGAVLLEYNNHFIIPVLCVDRALAAHHFHNLIVTDRVLRLVQSCIPSQTSSRRFIFIFRLQDGHRSRILHYLLLAPLRSQALPNELLLRVLVRVGGRARVRPLLLSGLAVSGRLGIFAVRVDRFFGDVS